ncbi:MAG: hypothetical protein HY023_10160 [Chloroflexi bacterium]|nr:hypothetical protein [Chloroflexota bacterium]MBI3764013.1 hypothetical protein [Chloroflexota bacterium]
MKNRIATLGTMSDLHAEATAYDLQTLAQIAAGLAPDLLCLEVARAAWEAGEVGRASLPIRAALAPVADRSDIVIIPVAAGPRDHADFTPAGGLRAAVTLTLERLHRRVQRGAGARTINGPWYGAFCHTVCALQEAAWTPAARAAWQAESAAMLANVLAAVRRDPGRRTLVAAQCQRKHWLDTRLRRESDVDFVDYWAL